MAQCVKIRIECLGSLVVGRLPPYPGLAEDQEATVHKDIDVRPHVHHLKVIDTEDEHEIIAYAKWEVYENGRPDLAELRQPMKESARAVDEFGRLREAAHEYFCTRNMEKGKHPHLRESLPSLTQDPRGLLFEISVLALLVTARKHRQRGAGSTLVRWGIELSERTGLPCYLQASEQGRRLYQHHGFEEIDTVDFNFFEYGLDGTEKMTEMTRGSWSEMAPEHEGSSRPG